MRLLIACLLTLVLAACDKQKPAIPQGSERAQPAAPTANPVAPPGAAAAPMVSFTGPDGSPTTLAAFRGRPLLVNLWATWCAPCIAEMPSIDRLAASEGTRLSVTAISQDGNGKTAVAPFFAKAGIKTLKPYFDPQNALMIAMKAETLPTTVIYDAKGHELWRHVGKINWDDHDMRDLLAAVLAGQKVPSV